MSQYLLNGRRLNAVKTSTLIYLGSISTLVLAEDYTAPPMVNIPAGTFQMGSDAGNVRNRPQHAVTLPDFQMGKYLVTVAEFRRFVQDTGYQPKANCVDYKLTDRWFGKKYEGTASWNTHNYQHNDYQAVTCVSYKDVNAYAAWLSEETGSQYRLPTEQEWEYALMGNATSRYFWGDDPNLTEACSYGNFADQAGEYQGNRQSGASYIGFLGHVNCNDDEGFTTLVGLYRPNPFGLYDMQGNVRQYLGSCYYPEYKPRTEEEMEPNNCEQTAARGGTWHGAPSQKWKRAWANKAKAPNFYLGFRLARYGHDDKTHPSTLLFESNLKNAHKSYLADRPNMPESPTSIQLVKKSDDTSMLSWQPSENSEITGYDIYQSIYPRAHLFSGFFERYYKKIKTVSGAENRVELALPETDVSFRVVAKTNKISSLPSEPVVLVEDKRFSVPGRLELKDVTEIENGHLKYLPAEGKYPQQIELRRYALGEQQAATMTEFNIEVKESAWYTLNYAGSTRHQGEFFKLWKSNALVGSFSFDKDIDDKTSNRHKVYLERGTYPLQMTIFRHSSDIWRMIWLEFTPVKN